MVDPLVMADTGILTDQLTFPDSCCAIGHCHAIGIGDEGMCISPRSEPDFSSPYGQCVPNENSSSCLGSVYNYEYDELFYYWEEKCNESKGTLARKYYENCGFNDYYYADYVCNYSGFEITKTFTPYDPCPDIACAPGYISNQTDDVENAELIQTFACRK